MNRRIPPPPTKFAASAQPKRQPMPARHPPPPVRFGAPGAHALQRKVAHHAAPPTKFAPQGGAGFAAAPVVQPKGAVRLAAPTPPAIRPNTIQKSEELNSEEYRYAMEDEIDEFEDDSDDLDFKIKNDRPAAAGWIFDVIYKKSSGEIDINGEKYLEFTCNAKKHHDKCDKRGNVVYVHKKTSKISSPRKRSGKADKPPLCHIVPWAKVRDVAQEKYAKEMNDELKKFLCWGNLSNLETGYDLCNSKDSDALPFGWNMSKVKVYVTFMKKIFDEKGNEPDFYGFP